MGEYYWRTSSLLAEYAAWIVFSGLGRRVADLGWVVGKAGSGPTHLSRVLGHKQTTAPKKVPIRAAGHLQKGEGFISTWFKKAAASYSEFLIFPLMMITRFLNS